MRSALTTAVVFLLIVAVDSASAEIATKDQAERVCANWLASRVHHVGNWAGVSDPQIIATADVLSESGDLVLAHCFLIEPRGYVIVPTLMELPPIKAYSEEYDLDMNDAGGFAQLIRDVLNHRFKLYTDTYGGLDGSQPRDGDVLFGRKNRSRWESLLKEPKLFKADLKDGPSRGRDEAGPLLTTAWHQGAPYNDECPMGDGGRCVVGCVATAAAQIMNYHEWPPQGWPLPDGDISHDWSGDNSCPPYDPVGGGTLTAHVDDEYDWANMPDNCDGGCSPTEESALAELCYEIGVAVHMDYGVCVSNAYTWWIGSAFVNDFRYRHEVDSQYREDHSPESWFSLIRAEINAERPVFYGIYTHAIVCDGWRVSTLGADQIHMNYGWADGHTAWYTLDGLYCPWQGCGLDEEFMLRRIAPIRAMTELLATDGAYNDYMGYQVAVADDVALVGAPYDDDLGIDSGSAYIFRLDGSSWTEEAKLLASDGAAEDFFGGSVSISGDVAVIGARYDDDIGYNSGSAYVFRRDGSAWVQEAKLSASDAESGDSFGWSVAISGDVVVVGAYLNDDSGNASGSAYIFRYNGSTWVQEAKLLAADGAALDRFGSSVAISHDVAVVGASYDDDFGSESGSAYVFRLHDSTWVEEAKLIASDGASEDRFGSSVAISDDLVVSGTPGSDDLGVESGSVYVFRFDGVAWPQEAKLLVTDAVSGDRIGRTVSASENVIVTGSFWLNSGYRGARVFRYDGFSWLQKDKLLHAHFSGSSTFAYSVAVFDDVAVVGGPVINGTGAAYVFDLSTRDGTYYEVWRSTTNDFGTATPIAAWHDSAVYEDTAASSGQNYYYWIRSISAEEAAGWEYLSSPYTDLEVTVRVPTAARWGYTSPIWYEGQITHNSGTSTGDLNAWLYEEDVTYDDEMSAWVWPNVFVDGPSGATKDITKTITIGDYEPAFHAEVYGVGAYEFNGGAQIVTATTPSLLVCLRNYFDVAPQPSATTGNSNYIRVTWNETPGHNSTFSSSCVGYRPSPPVNHSPYQPSNSSPINGATNIVLTPTLTASVFSDPDSGSHNDYHTASQWQVDNGSGFSSPEWDSGITLATTTADVPAGELGFDTTYYWRVRYRDNHGAWSYYSSATWFHTELPPNDPPDQPQNISPPDAATDVILMPTLTASDFSDPDPTSTHAASQWQVDDNSDFSSPAWDSGTAVPSTTTLVPAGMLGEDTVYYWRVRFRDDRYAWSEYSTATWFRTLVLPNERPDRPQNISPPDTAANISLTPTLTASAFTDPDPGDAHDASQWQVDNNATFASPEWDSGVAAPSTETDIPAGILQHDTYYFWRVRYRDDRDLWSQYSAVTWFHTETCFGDVDGDNTVGLSDLATLLANYGATGGATYVEGDLDGDGDVDLADLATLLAVYGTVCE